MSKIMSVLLLAGGLLLVVRRYRVEPAWWLKRHPIAEVYTVGLQLRLERRPVTSKPSSARPDSPGAVRGRFESLLANLRTDLRHGRQNGTEASNSISMDGFKSPPDHPIRDY